MSPLNKENEKLRADHETAALDLEMLSAEIQEIKEGRKKRTRPARNS